MAQRKDMECIDINLGMFIRARVSGFVKKESPSHNINNIIGWK